MTCSAGVTNAGCAASSSRSGIGSDRTHWRTGTWGMTWPTRCAAVCAISAVLAIDYENSDHAALAQDLSFWRAMLGRKENSTLCRTTSSPDC